MEQMDTSNDIKIKPSGWISGWVWFMSILNFLLIVTLGFVLWKVIPGVSEMRTAVTQRDQAYLERNQALSERDQAIHERTEFFNKRNIEMQAAIAERDQAILQRNQAIIERDQAFAERSKAFDQRFTEMQKRFDQASTTLNALDSQLALTQENQKKLGVLLLGQTDSFNATVNKLEELINALPR